jgi:hypothetical protein
MAWTELLYTPQQINTAAKALVAVFQGDDADTPDLEGWDAYFAALPVIDNWRSAHNYPLNTFQVTLRKYARDIDEKAIVAQRIKRLSSIEAKLRRMPNLLLSEMQDLGGCRAVLRSIGDVHRLVAQYDRSNIKHELASRDDYIERPKRSGYRGIHLVYRYYSDKQKKIYNGLKTEIQIRSRFQHAWATAVETVGTFVHQALKSSVGDKAWLRFFALMGSAIASRERAALVPGTPQDIDELLAELYDLTKSLNVENRLKSYGEALKMTSTPRQVKQAHYYLLELNPAASELKISGFKLNQRRQATESYFEAEKIVSANPGRDAVLVSVDSLSALDRAYPNYFADTRMFLMLLEQALSRRPRAISIAPKMI